MVSAWPEPPSAMSAEKSAGVRDGMEAFALSTTKTPPNCAGQEQSGIKRHWNGRLKQEVHMTTRSAFIGAGHVARAASSVR